MRRLVAVAAVSTLLILSGCAGGRISLGTGASACYKALPTAQNTVHHQGRLAGVRRVNTSTLGRRLAQRTGASTLPPEDVCVFAFDGSFPPGSVAGANSSVTGRYAIVAVSFKHPSTVVGTFVATRLPTRFRHLH